jgi:N-lysine methyltransferase SETD6
VRSLRFIRSGEEVLNYYGPYPNSDLLRRYGYISAKHSRYDAVEVPKTLVALGIQQQLQTVDAFTEKAVCSVGRGFSPRN